MQSIMAFNNAEEHCVNAALQATLACSFDAMPITEVSPPIFSLNV
jgi:hypothetical protein